MTFSNRNSETIKYWDDYENYELYYKGPWKYQRRRYVNEVRKKYAKKEDIKVLDLGCGRMSSLPALLSDSNIIAYHCVDASKESLKALRGLLGQNAKIQIYELDVIDFVNTCKERYDIVILWGLVMYLSRSDAMRLFSGLGSILNNGGMILLDEPNEKAKNISDPYAQVMTYQFLNSLISTMRDVSIAKIENYLIVGVRNPIFSLFRITRKILKKIGIKNRFIFLSISKFEDFLWYLESLLEAMLAKTKLGCNYTIVAEKD